MSVASDRQRFRDHVLRSEEYVRNGQVDAADRETGELETLTRGYERAGQATDFLVPLLAESEDPHVRYAAATSLLGAGQADLGERALEEIASGSYGVVSTEAGVVLSSWRRRTTDS